MRRWWRGDRNRHRDEREVQVHRHRRPRGHRRRGRVWGGGAAGGGATRRRGRRGLRHRGRYGLRCAARVGARWTGGAGAGSPAAGCTPAGAAGRRPPSGQTAGAAASWVAAAAPWRRGRATCAGLATLARGYCRHGRRPVSGQRNQQHRGHDGDDPRQRTTGHQEGPAPARGFVISSSMAL